LLAIRPSASACITAAENDEGRDCGSRSPGALVNELGFKYIGYVDGHNPRALVAAMREARQIKDGPSYRSCMTVKGKVFLKLRVTLSLACNPGR